MLTLQCDTNVGKHLQWLRGKGELCDVVVMSGDGQQTSAHSCVLAAHSTVIAAVLQGRLSSQRDWSVLRPLVISIDDASLKSSTQYDNSCTSEINVMETLVGLLYGEAVCISSVHLSVLHQYAHILGLSHQIRSCLEISKEKNTFLSTAKNSTSSVCNVKKSYARKKRSRKPGLMKNLGGKEVHAFKPEPVDELSLINASVHEEISSLHSKQTTGYPLPVALGDKTDCESSLLELSMLCSDDQDIDTCSGNNWNIDQGRGEHLNYEQQSNAQIQESISTCNFENTTPLEAARDMTSEASVGPLNVKMENSSHEESEIDKNMQGTNDILDLVVDAEEQVNLYCTDGQRLQHHQKKQQKHKSLGRGLVCSVCGSSFQRCGDLVKHVQNSQHFTSQCPLCFIQVRDVEGQRHHFALHDQKLPFFCMYCNLRFRTRAALTMHTPKHSDVKPFVCSDCGRGFKWRHALQAHSYTHSSSSRVLCDICGFSSKYVSSFKAHLVQHSGQAFPCPHPGCAFTSNRKSHLTDHLATHSKIRAYQCEVCGHSFSQAKNMRRHMRLHAPATNLLMCTTVSKLQCNFRTTRPDKLRDHLTKKHNLSRQAVSSETLPKLLRKSTLPAANSDANFVAKSSLDTLHSLSDIKTTVSSTDFTSVKQESDADMPRLENLNPKSDTVDSVTGTSDNNKDIQSSDQVKSKTDFPSPGLVEESHLGEQTIISNKQETFSVLTSDMVELPDIQSLECHTGQTVKQQSVAEIADNFPSGFLVGHNIMLDKSVSSAVNGSQELQTENSVSGLQDNLIPPTDHKLQLSVNDPIQNQGDLNLVSSNHVEPVHYLEHCTSSSHVESVSYPDNCTNSSHGESVSYANHCTNSSHIESVSYTDHCSFSGAQDSVVLEIMAPAGDLASSSSDQNPSFSLMDQESASLQEKSDKSEQCVESLTILEFMLDNVTD